VCENHAKDPVGSDQAAPLAKRSCDLIFEERSLLWLTLHGLTAMPDALWFRRREPIRRDHSDALLDTYRQRGAQPNEEEVRKI
jgi:hypothetical protein